MSQAKPLLHESSSKFPELVKTFDHFLYNIWFKLWAQLLDKALSYLVLTSAEKSNNGSFIYYVYNFLNFLLWIKLTILMTPIGVYVYCIWFILFRKLLRTRPFEIEINYDIVDNQIITNQVLQGSDIPFEILSMNVCLLPETLSRINNLHSAHIRLESIGNLLNKTKSTACCHLNVNETCLKKYSTSSNVSKKEETTSKSNNIINSKFNVNVIDDVLKQSNSDFLCLQELWTIETSKKLKSLISKTYKYICYDIGKSTFKLNKYIGFDSGLLVASKYPIVKVEFKQYSVKAGTCSLTGKGLLMIKVLLANGEKGKRYIGFISNTHLQAYQSKIFLINFFSHCMFLNFSYKFIF